ncbi:hypothetical protein, partial [Pseudomonas japonica]|uniref:hypothetical protein n=1 Tax=Pseudomonas japonica TaxID=256466 RepID=UPI001C611BE3
EFLVQLQTLDRFTYLSKREANSTALPPAVNPLFHRIRSGDRSHFPLTRTANSLILKKFAVPLSLEVGRIIRAF